MQNAAGEHRGAVQQVARGALSVFPLVAVEIGQSTALRERFLWLGVSGAVAGTAKLDSQLGPTPTSPTGAAE